MVSEADENQDQWANTEGIFIGLRRKKTGLGHAVNRLDCVVIHKKIGQEENIQAILNKRTAVWGMQT
ncbi:unnamed protein product [Arctogadus glacialis]